MLYYTGLEEVIFSKGEILAENPDELIIISGYLGPSPFERLKELNNMKITVVGGMYNNGIDIRLWNSLEEINKNNKNIDLLFTTCEIHSKIYIWKKNGKTLAALIGSANFSSSGLRKDFRESLADATRDTFSEMDRYFQFITKNSSPMPKIKKNQKLFEMPSTNTKKESLDISLFEITADIPLYTRGGEVPKSSGLNWGLSTAHTSEGDAYIGIPKNIIEKYPNLIKPFDPDYTRPDGKRKRNSDPIEIIWDDGFVMEASFEGIQKINGKKYPKQIASYSYKKMYYKGKTISNKSILGRYLRKRLKVNINEQITKKHLENYGRDTISLTFVSEGVYYADFSKKN